MRTKTCRMLSWTYQTWKMKSLNIILPLLRVCVLFLVYGVASHWFAVSQSRLKLFHFPRKRKLV